MKELHPLYSKYAIMYFPLLPFKLARRNRASAYGEMPWMFIKLYLPLALMQNYKKPPTLNYWLQSSLWPTSLSKTSMQMENLYNQSNSNSSSIDFGVASFNCITLELETGWFRISSAGWRSALGVLTSIEKSFSLSDIPEKKIFLSSLWLRMQRIREIS